MRRLLLILIILPSLSLGRFGPLDEVPIDRLIVNSELQLKKQPKNAYLHYQLGRLYSMRFAKDAKTAYVYLGGGREVSVEERLKGNPKYGFAPYEAIQSAREKAGKQLTSNELKYLLASLREYRKAMQLDPKDRLSVLGFAWMHEEAAPYAKQVGKVEWMPVSKPTSLDFRKYAAQTYRALYAVQKKDDLNNRVSMDLPNEFPAYQSAKSLLRLFKMGVQPKPGEVADLNATIKTINDRPKAITPIIFPLKASAKLIEPTARVGFDLAGDGVKREWPWISQDAAFLAWDPKGTGKITSAQQLFGSATFWMMYRDGYQALRSLDDNQDGWLTGRELKGIVAWHDKNANAKSDKGEVTPIGAYGVVAIRVQADSVANGMLSSRVGLRTVNGFIPTYDWMPTSHAVRK